MKARLISNTEIKLPTQEDYLEDGITFKDPILWYELKESTKPTDVTVFKDYTPYYSLVSLEFNGEKSIIMSWQAIYNEPTGRVGKLSNSFIITPKINETINGSLICNYDKLPNSRKMTDGWMLIEETLYPTDGNVYIQKGKIVSDELYGSKIKVVWELAPVTPEVPYDISKKKLLDILIQLGKFDIFQSILDSDKILHEYWLISVTLNSEDSIVKKMIPTFATMLEMSENDITMLLKKCII